MKTLTEIFVKKEKIMKKNMKRTIAGLAMAAVMAVGISGGPAFADSGDTAQSGQQFQGTRNGQCEFCQNGENRVGGFKNGSGFGAGEKRGMGKGNRTGPKDGSGMRAQDGTCVLNNN